MQQSNRQQWAKQTPDSLNFSQEQVTFILGHSLRSQYNDILAADLPDRLKALVQELENKQIAASDAR
ncbi:NepR family anti-sigma factor [Microvirga yunnanensis]|uniref:NepR family anti-sigma factor n=1 Tax=Microvirga yunnanensis TaxID=2953740 RepID=UPI0021C7470E|nr:MULTISPECIES: NepR family anti-sigma factor [unclassified Microvirga]